MRCEMILYELFIKDTQVPEECVSESSLSAGRALFVLFIRLACEASA